jgi:hypothetical protein
MLGDKIGTSTGKVTNRRVLPNPGGGPKVETSFESTTRLLGVDLKEMGTYWSVPRSDGTLYGEGQGFLMGANGELITWVGQGVGTMSREGAVSYRGAVYYSTIVPKFVHLNRAAIVFEYEVDAAGNTVSQLWEWK